ncbi:MAG: hypothetical protein OEW78_09120 [Nitrosopumilus sp.]|uniref:hypothetical protein n=1 Tax=Nitrosopumilus sp. TaxID=2024843 RepID=UPI00246E8D66|nr:hypothetical protein [Nitrosopumilus sp.]MDH5432023.1 hypothetical protein [Nitrosopumilus sp.]
MSFKPDREQNPNILDILLSKNSEKTIDPDTLIKNVQNRINKALEKGYQHTRVIDSSENS